MTQSVVDRYMEDDNVYRIIGFIQTNADLIIGFFVTGLVAFISGKIYGIRTQSVIFGLKEKYANIEQQKKKLVKQMKFLSWLDKAIKKLIFAVLFFEIVLLGNVIYHRGFDYSILLVNSLSRNILLGLVAVALLFLLSKNLVKRYNNSKKRHFLTIDSGMNEIGEKIIMSLGPELTRILKLKLLEKKHHNKEIGVQTREVEKRASVVNEFAEKEGLKKKVQEIECANVVLLKELEKHEINKNILKRDLNHYKDFLQQVREFEWCESCLQYAEKPEDAEVEEKEDKEAKDEKENKEEKDEVHSPEKTHPASEENSVGKNKSKHQDNCKESKDKDGEEASPKKGEPCKNDCLRRYFEVGFEISEQFNKEEVEISKLRERFQSMNSLN